MFKQDVPFSQIIYLILFKDNNVCDNINGSLLFLNNAITLHTFIPHTEGKVHQRSQLRVMVSLFKVKNW